MAPKSKVGGVDTDDGDKTVLEENHPTPILLSDLHGYFCEVFLPYPVTLAVYWLIWFIFTRPLLLCHWLPNLHLLFSFFLQYLFYLLLPQQLINLSFYFNSVLLSNQAAMEYLWIVQTLHLLVLNLRLSEVEGGLHHDIPSILWFFCPSGLCLFLGSICRSDSFSEGHCCYVTDCRNLVLVLIFVHHYIVH